MSVKTSQVELLKKLRIPETAGQYEPTTPVGGLADIYRSINLDDHDFRVFLAVIYDSVGDVVPEGSTDDEKSDYLKALNAALGEAMSTVQEARSLANRFRTIPADVTDDASQGFIRGLDSNIMNAHTHIGPIPLDPGIAVVDVEVEENYDVMAARAIRSVTDPVIRGNKNDVSLSITLEFPEDRINDKYDHKGNIVEYGLRSLIATLKTAPVCEISSAAIVPVFLNAITAPELFEAVRRQVVQETIGDQGLENRRSAAARTLMQSEYSDNLTAFKNFVGSLNPIIDFMTESGPNKNNSTDFKKDNPNVSLAAASLPEARDTITVPCAFRGAIVRTSPEKTNHLQVKLIFSRFNSTAWQPGKVLYRDKNGDLTSDPMECPWIMKMAYYMFMQEDNRKNGGDYMSPYMRPEGEETGALEFTWLDNNSLAVQKFAPAGKTFVVEEVEARTLMKTVTLPLLGQVYPVCQYMGIDNVHARFTCCVTSPFELAKFHEMKADLDRIAYEDGPNNHRRHFVTIKNNLLNFLGAYDFVITGITTRRVGEEEKWMVEFEVIESRISFEEVEQIVIEGDSLQEVKDAKIIWDHLYDLLTETVNKTVRSWVSTGTTDYYGNPVRQLQTRHEVVNLVYPKDVNNPTELELKSEGQYAWQLVFGGESTRRDTSILNMNIMAAAWFSLTQKTKNEYGRIRWDTGPNNDPLVSAVMEGSQLALPGNSKLNEFTRAVVQQLSNNPLEDNYGQGSGLLFASHYIFDAYGNRKLSRSPITGKYNPASIFNFNPDHKGDTNRLGSDLYWTDYLSAPLSADELLAQKVATAWLSKGRADRGDEWHQRAREIAETFGDDARFNIREQGRRLLNGGGTTVDEIPLSALPASPSGVLANGLLNSTDIGRAIQGPLQIRDLIVLSTDSGDIINTSMSVGHFRERAFFTKEIWDEYFDIVMYGRVRADAAEEQAWTNEDIDEARQLILGLVRTAAYNNFPSIRDKIATSDYSAKNRVRVSVDQAKVTYENAGDFKVNVSNYADMNLPTYAAMFTENGKAITVPESPGSSQHIELWRKFAPTYSDLGKPVSFSRKVAFEDFQEAAQQIARNINDPIEPDLPYYHVRKKPDAVAAMEDGLSKAERAMSDVYKGHRLVVPNEVSKRGPRAISDYLRQLWLPPSRRSDPLSYERQSDHDAINSLSYEKYENGERRRSAIMVIDQEGTILGNVKSGRDGGPPVFDENTMGVKARVLQGDGSNAFDLYDNDHMARMNHDLVSRVPDNTQRMSRLFPAYRLYFIEQDRGRSFLVDDLYGVNSVIEMSIRKHKYDADVLVAKISNVTGNLSTEEILHDGTAEKLGLVADDEGEPYFSKLKLQSGVLVQVKMGYSSKEEDLDIVFTGMITEITPGQVVEIVAQGHKRELLNEVQFDMESINHFDIIRKVMEKTEHPNLGDPMKARQFSLNTVYGDLFPVGQDPSNYVGMMDYVFNKEVVNMTNVYMVSNAPLESDRKIYLKRGDVSSAAVGDSAYNVAGAVGERVVVDAIGGTLYEWFAGGVGFIFPDRFEVNLLYDEAKHAKWVIPPQTAWEAILEVVRHRPGHVAQVVPFETRGTLFVGQPDQPYVSHTPNNFERITYAKLQPLLDKTYEVDFHAEILYPFLKSKWSRVYRAHFLEYGSNETNPRRAPSWKSNAAFDVEDVMSLDGLPDEDDKQNFIKKLTNGQVPLTSGKRLRTTEYFLVDSITSKIGDLPAGFNFETDWWLYGDDLQVAWDYLNDIDPTILENLFIWFYDLDSSRSQLTVAPFVRDLKQMFYSTENKIFENFVDHLENNYNNSFSIAYGSVKNADEELVHSIPLLADDSVDQIEVLLNKGLITAEKAAEMRRRINDVDFDYIPRSELQDAAGGLIRSSEGKYLSEVLMQTGGAFRLFVYYIYRSMLEDVVNQNKMFNPARIRTASRKMKMFQLPPGYEVFRKYHLIGPTDLIENKIVATMAEMSNCCLVRSPSSPVDYDTEPTDEEEKDIIVDLAEQEWRSYPTTDGIPFTYKIGKNNRKLGVVYELNAIHDDQKAMTLLSNMGGFLQPMYRGSYTIIGRNIKPHDVVYIHDTQNDLRGHIDTEAVVHHFSPTTGWITEVVPHTLVRVNNPTAEIQLGSMQSFMRDMQAWIDVLDVGLTALAIGGFVFSGPGMGLLSAGIKQGLAKVGESAAVNAVKSGAKGIIKTGMENFVASELSTLSLVGLAIKETVVGAGAKVARGKAYRVGSSVASAIGRQMVTGLGAAGFGFLVGGIHLADMVTSLYVKHQLSSTELPIDVHLLTYRGQKFQAGLEVNDEDIYSIFEKFEGTLSNVYSDFSRGVSEAITEIFTLKGGVTNPYEEAVQRVRER